MEIPYDIVKEQASYLSVGEFLQLCQTSKLYSQLCSDNNLWQSFIHRDFGYKYTENDAKDEYIYAATARRLSVISDPVNDPYVILVLHNIGFEKTRFGYAWLRIPIASTENPVMLTDLTDIDSILFEEGEPFSNIALYEQEDFDSIRNQVISLLPPAFFVKNNIVQITNQNMHFIYDYWSKFEIK